MIADTPEVRQHRDAAQGVPRPSRSSLEHHPDERPERPAVLLGTGAEAGAELQEEERGLVVAEPAAARVERRFPSAEGVEHDPLAVGAEPRGHDVAGGAGRDAQADAARRPERLHDHVRALAAPEPEALLAERRLLAVRAVVGEPE